MVQAFDLTADSTKPAKGMYAYMPNIPQKHNVIFKGNEGDTIIAGEFVKLDTTSTDTTCPVVVACETTDVPYGMVVYDILKSTYKVGDKVALANSGDSVFLIAGNAITVGSKLQFDPATGYVDATETEGNAYIGIAETSAGAQGDFVQVALDFNLGVQTQAE